METRRSLADPVPPPPNPALSYDQAQLLVRRCVCRGCGTEYCVPVRIDPHVFVCSRCSDGQ